jgi:hypothetical protein
MVFVNGGAKFFKESARKAFFHAHLMNPSLTSHEPGRMSAECLSFKLHPVHPMALDIILDIPLAVIDSVSVNPAPDGAIPVIHSAVLGDLERFESEQIVRTSLGGVQVRCEQ